MNYPDIRKYEKLYRRFLLGDRSEQMLDLYGDISDKIFLDICCGGGRLTKAALKRNTKKNIMIDSEINMMNIDICKNLSTEIYINTVENAFKELLQQKESVDVAICQQGINYWLTKSKAWKLSLIMPEGGIFIFNTFNNKPSEIPKIKEYTLTNPYTSREIHYMEINWLVKEDWFDVYHVQICQGEQSHFTKFRWMSEGYIRESLEKFFNVELITDGKTSIYKCIKK